MTHRRMLLALAAALLVASPASAIKPASPASVCGDEFDHRFESGLAVAVVWQHWSDPVYEGVALVAIPPDALIAEPSVVGGTSMVGGWAPLWLSKSWYYRWFPPPEMFRTPPLVAALPWDEAYEECRESVRKPR